MEILQRQDDRGGTHHVWLARDGIGCNGDGSDRRRADGADGGRDGERGGDGRDAGGHRRDDGGAGDCGAGAATDVRAGDLIRVREGVWRVMEVRTFARPIARTRVLRLIGADDVNRWQPCTLLEPFDRPRRVEAARTPRVVSRARWMRTCAALLAASPPAGCPATIADAQVTLMPHQIDPVLAVLRGRASRVLLADAVGLGKTIQAALLLRELRARGCGERVLVLVPSGLRDQWRQELSHRAALRGVIVDAAALAARTRELPPDVNPWSLPGILIVSLDFIKQPSVLRGASAIAWDVLIVDEAHNLNEGTDRLAAADLLARHSRHVMLLTATPHHGSDDAFGALCRIGQTGSAGEADEDDDPIAIFRRTRETMGLTRTRKVHVLRVTPTKQERRLHTFLARYATRVERERVEREGIRRGVTREGADRERADRERASRDRADRGDNADRDHAERDRAHRDRAEHDRAEHDGPDAMGNGLRSHAASLAMSVLLKRASSSAASLERSLRRRLALLDGSMPAGSMLAATPDAPRQPCLPLGDENDDLADDIADGEPSHVLGAPGLRSARVERAWLTLLIEASRSAARAESKPRALARLLRRCGEPALIYTEYRDTLTHLARTLFRTSASGLNEYAMLHGGLTADVRRDALSRFAAGEARVLLTTDAAGEGLNLHHRCRLVINVELPWNPNRLEQRIGRVDRLGQTRTVHAIHLVAADTAEEHMLTRLTGRVGRIAATLGDAPDVLRVLHEESVGVGAAAAVSAADAAAATASDADVTHRDTMPSDDKHYVNRSVSVAAAEATAQLQLLRALRTRAWRSRRRDVGGTYVSRKEPLLALDERAPLIAVTRRHGRHSSGLLCVWRTRMHRDEGRTEGGSRASPPVLTAMHIGCEVPRFEHRRAVAAFVTATIDRCRARIQPLLDRELAAARECFDAAEHARLERLASRSAAIDAALTAARRARAADSGWLQPLLFEDIASEKLASEKTTTAAALAEHDYASTRDESGRSRTMGSIERPNTSDTSNTPNTPNGAGDLLAPSLVMVLVLR